LDTLKEAEVAEGMIGKEEEASGSVVNPLLDNLFVDVLSGVASSYISFNNDNTFYYRYALYSPISFSLILR
jgi:hypothetical protein